MPTFNKDLFISYAHIDNQPLTPGDKGWITRFHASLEALLSMKLGQTARIWRDDHLQTNDVFADEIVDQFAQTAVLVSVLTPRYLNSEWCTREVAEFCKRAEQRGGVTVENKSRIFKVLKTPVDTQESLPSAMKGALGIEFYTTKDEVPLELDAAFGEEYAQAYNLKVNKLAYEVAQLLKKLATDTGDNAQDAQVSAKATVYLAECSYDRKEIREILEGDLQCHGYTVLPDRQLPRDEADYIAAVQSLLERCTLSIHLIGDNYGAVPDGPRQKSVGVLQNEFAVERSKSDALQRVIWLPEGTTSEQAQQQAFIKALHDDADVQFGADLIIGDVETLKTSIHATLKKLEKPEPKQLEAQTASGDGTKLIYLICSEKDRKATVPVRKFLREQGFEVATPVFQGDASVVREANRQSMSHCDAVMLFYGTGDEGWKHTQDNELKKMPGYRDEKPLLASYTYLAEPKTADKEDLIEMEDMKKPTIDGLEGFSPVAMAEFMQVMNAAGKTS
ncbi:toll/interleukin-1 receptor domain-containing protein [Candidatus Nitrospira neomarina]|uniref:Toll/interleukin-1 receptor domain-containing protein n=1 Tax=Candidatus Nitrospira neomarina TaxID=3020899 RepID=A0AA96GRK2_9BACT|nr:toll/interleukin-1 receptor domain-containing protein [Candidatus Nitrospira neomarina]WNM62261.1 toll/interleukin-1 receptor domain-containing protein [Candidatus Nitrospira neomarina]